MMLVMLLAILSITTSSYAFAEKNTFVDTVKFIQYLDENTALEDVRKGILDVYYYSISADRLDGINARDLQIYDSAGGSYSILVNPAESEKFNPFSIEQVRFALNYLIDRKLIVNELMSGFGVPTNSYYGPYDPEYITVIGELESLNFKYNPKLAEEMISEALLREGAVQNNGVWLFNDKQIEITIFIRSDDPVRKSIGEILATNLQNIGFVIKKDFGDLNKAFVVVYGSDPAELKWNLYTEGWGRSAFVRYDSVGLGQMYSPWFSSMPGFNNPDYWNYKNDELDSLTQKIYTGEFDDKLQRAKLIQDAITLGVEESVRIFLATKIDRYVTNESVNGVINEFGAGIPSRFTPINARVDDGKLDIGVKQIYQGAWNPVMGLSDYYSRYIWGIVSDPAAFQHPFTGEVFPIRATWEVNTKGPDGKMELPEEAAMWNVASQSWENVQSGTRATSMITFDLKFANWHHGEKMDMTDILYSIYFMTEWGTHSDENDKTFDTEFTPRVAQILDTIIGINPIDEDTIEVYVDYWHFDEKEIAGWASMWSVVPWEISVAMEQAVLDGKVSFSRSGATSKNVNWLSLIIPNDAQLLKEYLKEYKEQKYIPAAISDVNQDYVNSRYDSSISWIEDNNHAVISNGPFQLESYSPESRTITVNSFADDTYPFDAGHWSEFESTKLPTITSVKIPETIQKGKDMQIIVQASDATSILYFLTDRNGNVISDEVSSGDVIIPGSKTDLLRTGANDIKIFAMSKDVLRPDFYTYSFLALEEAGELPKVVQTNNVSKNESADMTWILIPIIGIALLIIIIKFKTGRTV